MTYRSRRRDVPSDIRRGDAAAATSPRTGSGRMRSSQVLDPNVKSRAAAAAHSDDATAAEVSMNTGSYINVQGVAKLTGRDLGIENIEQVLNDPALQMAAMQQQAMMPQQGQGCRKAARAGRLFP